MKEVQMIDTANVFFNPRPPIVQMLQFLKFAGTN